MGVEGWVGVGVCMFNGKEAIILILPVSRSYSSSLLQVLLQSVNSDGSATKLTEMTMKVTLSSPPSSLLLPPHPSLYSPPLQPSV